MPKKYLGVINSKQVESLTELKEMQDKFPRLGNFRPRYQYKKDAAVQGEVMPLFDRFSSEESLMEICKSFTDHIFDWEIVDLFKCVHQSDLAVDDALKIITILESLQQDTFLPSGTNLFASWKTAFIGSVPFEDWYRAIGKRCGWNDHEIDRVNDYVVQCLLGEAEFGMLFFESYTGYDFCQFANNDLASFISKGLPPASLMTENLQQAFRSRLQFYYQTCAFEIIAEYVKVGASNLLQVGQAQTQSAASVIEQRLWRERSWLNHCWTKKFDQIVNHEDNYLGQPFIDPKWQESRSAFGLSDLSQFIYPRPSR
jgi:hypothetical protein